MKSMIAAVTGAACFLAVATPAAAYTECQAQVDYLYFGDNGALYIYLVNGTIGIILNSNADKSSYLSIALTAKAASRPLSIRLTPNGASCAGYHTDVEGVTLR